MLRFVSKDFKTAMANLSFARSVEQDRIWYVTNEHGTWEVCSQRRRVKLTPQPRKWELHKRLWRWLRQTDLVERMDEQLYNERYTKSVWASAQWNSATTELESGKCCSAVATQYEEGACRTQLLGGSMPTLSKSREKFMQNEQRKKMAIAIFKAAPMLCENLPPGLRRFDMRCVDCDDYHEDDLIKAFVFEERPGYYSFFGYAFCGFCNVMTPLSCEVWKEGRDWKCEQVSNARLENFKTLVHGVKHD